jgi:hypothetical protein
MKLLPLLALTVASTGLVACGSSTPPRQGASIAHAIRTNPFSVGDISQGLLDARVSSADDRYAYARTNDLRPYTGQEQVQWLLRRGGDGWRVIFIGDSGPPCKVAPAAVRREFFGYTLCSGPPRLTGRFFSTPANDIACEVDNQSAVGPFTGQRTLACVVLSMSGKRGQRTWGMRTTGTPRVVWVMGNIAVGSPVVPYGASWSYEGFSCQSRLNDLMCTNRSHHGFVLSTKTQRTF